MEKNNSFFENSLADYISDLQKKLNKTSCKQLKKVFAGKIDDARAVFSQHINSELRHNVRYTGNECE